MFFLRYLIPALFLFLQGGIFPQEDLYMPKEIRTAYLKNTRSFDGRPGLNYWQNHSSYKIEASIDPAKKLLTGSEVVKYKNNSPDTLKRLVFKLFQNLNKIDSPRNFSLPAEAVNDGMKITSLKIQNSGYDIDPAGKMINIQGTNLIIMLTQPLPPGGETDIEVSWNFTIPPGVSNPRMGYTDSASFFIAYWYPKIAVYDDINGWDMYSYEGEHEFYFEYSDYEVNLTLPHGYLVWSTGMCRNLTDILSDDILKKYNLGLAADSVIKVITKPDIVKRNIFRSKEKNVTWKLHASNIPDFAFGTSSHYVWQMTSVKMNGRKILVHTAFNPDNETYNEVINFAKGAVEQFPDGLQGIPYPYPHITIFNGDSGMEFPMIVNDAPFPNRSTDVYVTIHETTHMFFPFFTAMSETKYGWFDEGMAYLLPQKIQLSFDPADHRVRAVKGYSQYAGKETDLPLMTPSFFVREPDLSMLCYYKSAIAFDMLRDLLGNDMFRKCLSEFIHAWNGKHPTPYDFFFIFNTVSGKNLNWFFREWFFERGFPDTGIKEVKNENGSTIVIVESPGNYPVPVHLTFSAQDGSKHTIEKTPEIWSNGQKEIVIETNLPFDPVSVKSGADWIPDSNPKNNLWKKEK